MSSTKHPSRRRQPPWGRIALVAVFIAVSLYAGFHILFQAPEQKPPEQDEIVQQTDPLPADASDPQAEAAAQALRSHLERKENFYTILVSGVDNHAGGSDTNILVAVDAVNDYIYGVSIPRDTKAVIDGESRKINFAYNSGGMDLMAQVISEQLGIPVDYTVQVDMQGFSALVNAIGGVDFYVPIDMVYADPVQDLYIDIPQGMRRLYGEDALKVVRFREGYASQDIGRMETQQAFLKAAAKQTLTLSNLDKVDDFSKIFQTYVETDLTLGNLAWLAKEAIGMGEEAIHFSTLPGEWKSPYIYLDAEAVLTLVNEYLNPYVEDRVPEDLNIPS